MKNKLKIWLILISCAIMFLCGTTFALSQGNATEDNSTSANDTSVVPSDVPSYDDFLAEEQPGNEPGVFSTTSLLNLLFSVIIVVIAIWAFGYVLRYIFAKLPGYSGRDDFKVLGTLKLSTQSSLYVVRFMDEIYLLAGTGQRVNLITQISDPQKVQEILDTMETQPSGVNPHAFGTLLSKRMRERIEDEGIKEKKLSLERGQSNLKDTLERLKNIEDESD